MFFSVVCSGGPILYRRVRVQNCMHMEGLTIPDVFVFEDSVKVNGLCIQYVVILEAQFGHGCPSVCGNSGGGMRVFRAAVVWCHV